MKKGIECVVTGRVQLVMFRDFVKRNARSLGLVGTVQNLSDGSVEVVAEGDEKNLLKLIGVLYHGSLLSRVDDVKVLWREPTNVFSNFNILYT